MHVSLLNVHDRGGFAIAERGWDGIKVLAHRRHRPMQPVSFFFFLLPASEFQYHGRTRRMFVRCIRCCYSLAEARKNGSYEVRSSILNEHMVPVFIDRYKRNIQDYTF